MTVDARLAAPAACCWAGAAVLIAAPHAAGVTAVCAWLAALGAVCGALAVRLAIDRTHTVLPVLSGIGLCLAAIAIVAGSVATAAPMRQPSGLAAAAQGHVVHVIARIDGAPRRAQAASAFGAARVLVAVTASSIRLGEREFRGRVPMTAYVDAGARSPRIGEVYGFDGTLRAYPASDESAFSVYASGDLQPLEAAPPIYAWANTLRAGFSSAASRLPGEGGALLPGLSIGDVSAVGAALNSDMKASSLTHLTAVSGANCAVVIALMMVGGAAIGLRRGLRVGLALAALGGFVVLVTPQPSVLRAAVMATVVVLSAAAGRPGRGVPALCVAVIALLVADPWLALDYGFALSVLATAGLLVLAPMLAATMQRWMPRSVALAVSIPLAAQIACQPVLLMLNPTVPLYGVVANLLAEPAAPIATVIGLVACLVLPVLPAVGTACAWVAWVPSAWIAGVAQVTAALPGSALPWLTGLAGVALMATITALVVIAVRPERADGPPRRLWHRARWLGLRRRRGGGARWSSRTIAITLLLLFGACYLGGSVGGDVGRHAGRPADWQLGACDIGQGDALLVRDGVAHGLVDVGPDPKPLTTCLSDLGIGHIDLLVLTHYDADHVGGLAAVTGKVTTALVTVPADAHARRVVSDLRAGGADVRVAAAGDAGTLGRLTWRVLWPVASATVGATSNELGLAVKFAGRGIRSIFLADLDERAQNALLETGTVGPVDVVKVAHHGSADQSAELYRALQPRVGMISVGAGNTYGHPTAALLRILTGLATRILRTDVNGMYLVAPQPDGGMSVWTQRPGDSSELTAPGDRGG